MYSDDDDDNNNADGSCGNNSDHDVTSSPPSPMTQASGLPPLPPLNAISRPNDVPFNPLTSASSVHMPLPPPPPLHHMYATSPFGLPPAGGAPPMPPFNLYGSAPGSGLHPFHSHPATSRSSGSAADPSTTMAKSPAAAAATTVKQEPKSTSSNGFVKSDANSSRTSLAPSMQLTIVT